MARQTSRRTFLKIAGTAAAVAPLSVAGAAQAKRNVILYVTDDQGTNDAGCYGHPVIKTPGLDELAAHGTRFTHAFCTAPSCSPSRAVMLTGLHTHANGQYGLAHSYHHFASFGQVQSLPAILANAGYRTIAAGKLHVAPPEVYPFEVTLPVKDPVALVESARPHLESSHDRPFFMLIGTVEPHRPFKRQLVGDYSPNEVVVPPFLPDTPECRNELAAYSGSVQQADLGLAQLINVLRETGRWDDTLVICVSDNGMAFPGAKTNLYEPGTRLPCVIRNPHGARQSAVCHAMVTWCDLTPTILDYAGVLRAGTKLPAFHGRSLLPVLEHENPEGWDEVFLSHTFHEVTMYYPMRCLRERQYKLIWNIAHELEFPFASDLYQSATWQGVLKRDDNRYGQRTVQALLHRPEFELYDLLSDPGETHNLFHDPAHRDALNTLQQKLRAYQEKTSDPWILKWDRE